VRARRELIAALDELLATAAKQQAVLVAVSAPDLLAEVLRPAAAAGVE
jgi:predicted ATPase